MAWPRFLRGRNLYITLAIAAVLLTIIIIMVFLFKGKSSATTSPPAATIMVTTTPAATPMMMTPAATPMMTPTATMPAPTMAATTAPPTRRPVLYRTRQPYRTGPCLGMYGDGPIYSNWGAQNGQCASVCRRLRPGSVFTGKWRTVVEGRRSVCECRSLRC